MLWGFLFLAGAVSVGGGTLAYLYRDSRRREAEAEAAWQEALARLPELLMRELRSGKLSEFDIEAFAERCEVDLEGVLAVASDLYAKFASQVVADGIVTEDERKKLDRLAGALRVNPEAALRIEGRAKSDRYREAVAGSLADGVLSAEERRELDALRAGLGMSKAEAYQAGSEVTEEAYVDLLRRVAYAGPPDPQLGRYVAEFRGSLGLERPEARNRIREPLNSLYREMVNVVISDGEVTEAEEEMLRWLRSEVGIGEDDARRLHERLERTKGLARIRGGQLPSVPTSMLIDGGEICHWQGQCIYHYATRSGNQLSVGGDLVVTSRRIILSGPDKSFEFGPSKIIDISFNKSRDGLILKTSVSKGAGTYRVTDPEYLEAVLCGVVRKHKYLLTEGYSSERSRHIPKDVRREVYARDGGRCVECGSADYLEFDHIIPHAKGGANTTNNVQLLCRRCNNEKKDRI